MTIFKDLSRYNYFEPTPHETELNVGWIDCSKLIPKSEPTKKLLELIWSYCGGYFMQSRGLYSCDLCGRQIGHKFNFLGETKTLGSAEIRVFGKNGIIYCAPDLIFHYIQCHQYAPPREFVESVIEGPHPGSIEYLELAQGYNCADKWLKYIPKYLPNSPTTNS